MVTAKGKYYLHYHPSEKCIARRKNSEIILVLYGSRYPQNSYLRVHSLPGIKTVHVNTAFCVPWAVDTACLMVRSEISGSYTSPQASSHHMVPHKFVLKDNLSPAFACSRLMSRVCSFSAVQQHKQLF